MFYHTFVKWSKLWHGSENSGTFLKEGIQNCAWSENPLLDFGMILFSAALFEQTLCLGSPSARLSCTKIVL
jgi:hypothetical protein